MTFEFSFSVNKEGEISILHIKGRLDAISSPKLETKVKEIIASGCKKLLINFNEVDYLSSAGMRLLLATAKKLKEAGGTLVISDLNDDILEIIKIAGLERVLRIYPDMGKALKEI